MSENLSKLDDSPTGNKIYSRVDKYYYCRLLMSMQHKQDIGAPYPTPVR